MCPLLWSSYQLTTTNIIVWILLCSNSEKNYNYSNQENNWHTKFPLKDLHTKREELKTWDMKKYQILLNHVYELTVPMYGYI